MIIIEITTIGKVMKNQIFLTFFLVYFRLGHYCNNYQQQ